MWNWFNCYLSGRHEYGPWCEPGTIFLRCMHCGRRSSGWAIDAKSHVHTTAPAAGAIGATDASGPGRDRRQACAALRARCGALALVDSLVARPSSTFALRI